jgi:prevent-host-death family protein
MVTATIFEAKTKLSELVKKAQAGEKVVITSGRRKVPVVELTPVQPKQYKRLGAVYNPKFELPDDFFVPDLDDEDGD